MFSLAAMSIGAGSSRMLSSSSSDGRSLLGEADSKVWGPAPTMASAGAGLGVGKSPFLS